MRAGAQIAFLSGLTWLQRTGSVGRGQWRTDVQHILVATDGSQLAARAVAEALKLAAALGARVTAVTATEPWSAMVAEGPALAFPVHDYEAAAVRGAERILAGVNDAAKAAGVDCTTVHARDFPAEAIVETARAGACDLIAMGSHGRRGLSRLLLGSQAMRVLASSPVPVLVCR